MLFFFGRHPFCLSRQDASMRTRARALSLRSAAGFLPLWVSVVRLVRFVLWHIPSCLRATCGCLAGRNRVALSSRFRIAPLCGSLDALEHAHFFSTDDDEPSLVGVKTTTSLPHPRVPPFGFNGAQPEVSGVSHLRVQHRPCPPNRLLLLGQEVKGGQLRRAEARVRYPRPISYSK